MGDVQYLVQCISGQESHVATATPGSELERLCKQRAEAGFIDALCLGPDDCPACVEDIRERIRREEALLDMLGCPIGDIDGCAEDCPCNTPEVVPDSPYDGQLVYLQAASAES